MTCVSRCVATVWAIAVVAVLALLLPCRAGNASGWSVGGYFKSFFTALDAPTILADDQTLGMPVEAVVSNRLRLHLSLEASDAVRFSLAYGVLPQVLSRDGSLGARGLADQATLSYRAKDFRRYLYPRDGEPHGSFGLAQNLDRLSITLSPSFADVTLGRQAVAFGSGRVINPTDVIAPFTYEALDKEERVGVDAIRVRTPMGRFSELDAGFVLGEDGRWDASAAFLRAQLYVWETDVSPIVLTFRENLLLGIDVARTIGGATGWFEAAYTFEGGHGDAGYLRLSCGLDRQLAEGLYGAVEYHFNGPGSADANGYIDLASDVAYTDGAVYLLGRHYIAPVASYQATPLLTVGVQGLVNLDVGSAFVSPTFTYSFADEVVVEGGAFLGLGTGPRLTPTTEVAPTSEFGSYPDLYFTGVRLYF